MMQPSESKEKFLSNFNTFERSLNGTESSAFHTLRKNAIRTFAGLEFPTRHHEEWKYTNVNPILEKSFQLSTAEESTSMSLQQLEPFFLPQTECYRLVFINGYFAQQFSSSSSSNELSISNLGSAVKSGSDLLEKYLCRYISIDQDIFTALNCAFIKEGAFILIPDQCEIEKPIHILFVSTSPVKTILTNPRSVIVVGNRARAKVIESYVGSGNDVYFTNAATEIVVGEHASLEHMKIQNETEAAFHIATTHIEQARSSRCISHNISSGGALVRNNIHVALNGEGSESTLNGLYVAHHNQHVDNHTVIDHVKPHCMSFELYKGILDDESRGVFNGKIIVHPDAQKTNAKQQNKNLLLSDTASIDTKPQLEIFANDVRCTHGATVGQLDDDALFYLRARGIGLDAARALLTHAFASELINRISIESLREQLEMTLTAKLKAK